MTQTARYDDVAAWANEQARFLREGRLDLLDTPHLAGEIVDLGKCPSRIGDEPDRPVAHRHPITTSTRGGTVMPDLDGTLVPGGTQRHLFCAA